MCNVLKCKRISNKWGGREGDSEVNLESWKDSLRGWTIPYFKVLAYFQTSLSNCIHRKAELIACKKCRIVAEASGLDQNPECGSLWLNVYVKDISKRGVFLLFVFSFWSRWLQLCNANTYSLYIKVQSTKVTYRVVSSQIGRNCF